MRSSEDNIADLYDNRIDLDFFFTVRYYVRHNRSLCYHRVCLEYGSLVRFKHHGLGLLDHHLPGQGLDAVSAATVEFSVTVRTPHLIPALTVLRLVSWQDSTVRK